VARRMDDRPVARDKPYIEPPRPPMSAFGVLVRRRILDERLAANYKASADNQRLIIGNLRDFLRAAQILRGAHLRPLALTRTEDGLMFDARSPNGGDGIGIEVRLENSETLIESGVKSGFLRATADRRGYVTTQPLTDKLIALIIAGLVPKDPELLETDG
jgi:hypothetical protein